MKMIDWVAFDSIYPEVPYEPPDCDRYQEARAAVIAYLREHPEEACSGFTHQQGEEGAPFFDTGETLCCSFREWGGLVYEALHPDGTDPMGYCEWAWADPTGLSSGEGEKT